MMNVLIAARRLTATARDFLADLLFPRACVGCETPETYLCDACAREAPRLRERRCPACDARVTPDGRTCPSCAPKHPLDGIFSPFAFREASTIAEAIHVLKYEYVPDLALPLGALVADAMRGNELPIPDVVIPVPLHPWRLRYRGFNQSALIAQSFSVAFLPDMPLPIREDIIVRHRFTLPQAGSRGAKERRNNLRDAFSLHPGNPGAKRDLAGCVVWLVDDVATTGATLEECAKVLKKAGARSVFGIVVAR